MRSLSTFATTALLVAGLLQSEASATDCWVLSADTNCCQEYYPSVYRGPICGGTGSTPSYCPLLFNFPSASNPTVNVPKPSTPNGAPYASFTEAQVADCIGHRAWCVEGVCLYYPGNHTDFYCGDFVATVPAAACGCP